ncbi:alpha/beta family hydrolase [Gilvimarinus algae]|uniref:Alpha/beta hydrolase n=1 Tax=Gilvimarinus algae TaxID=3058037 RepID=A0ABT8T8X8_9GAMM|nr:alpha/beta family hydrolase [Gilvimarinus sp. SDUM040014]MDO3380587.1 alpha/beta hydrolase [Gilvimarinus sp. SDUM040014]
MSNPPESWLVEGPRGAAPSLVLAHGAGAPMDSEFMQAYSRALAQRGVRVCRFEFPYMQQRRDSGKKRPPDRAPVLIEAFRQALEQARALWPAPVFIGGKSMGGRMASHLGAEPGVGGVICLGYPFHPPGKPDKLRLESLQACRVPALVLQGTRDRLGNADEVVGYDLPAQITLHWFADGDHDLKPRVASGFTHEHYIERAAEASAEFIHGGGQL